MKIYKAPQAFTITEGKLIFLAGSIDMGNAMDWQSQVINFFKDKHCTILNPRRDDWDSNWKQSPDNAAFSEQVNWELDAMGRADLIIMNFLPGSQSPVTLLELGLMAASGKLKVCCPASFWRSGNVLIVCKRYNIPVYNDLAQLLSAVELQD
ncbi:MAG: nucleoside 2-deoxyribosyltransferase domain-containing protein [Ferruginibacter sp.]